MASAHCRAVFGHDQRIAPDGAPAEAIDAEAKDLAAKRLALLSTREAAQAAKKAAKVAAPAAVKRKPAPPPPTAKLAETPEQLRARVRAGLLRRTVVRSFWFTAISSRRCRSCNHNFGGPWCCRPRGP
jgi:hypothetical protein